MGSKNKAQVPGLEARPSPPAGRPPWVLIGGLVAVAVVAVVALYPGSTPEETSVAPGVDAAIDAAQDTAERATAPVVPTRAASPAHPTDVPLPSLPLVPNMVPRAPEVIRSAYAFAAHNPHILEYVPCFCGCESAGHTGNADCFVKSRNPDGTVNSWEQHGQACVVCIDVARDAMQLHASGGSVRDIRSAIVAKYGPQSPRQTPTPEPPLSQ